MKNSRIDLVLLGSLLGITVGIGFLSVLWANSNLVRQCYPNLFFGGACNSSKGANDGTCREEGGCSASASCSPLDPHDPDNSLYECTSSIAPYGDPEGSVSGYALLKNADGWRNGCDTPEQGLTTCSPQSIACAIEVKCLRSCLKSAHVFGTPPTWRCQTDTSAPNNAQRGIHADYSATGVVCPVQ